MAQFKGYRDQIYSKMKKYDPNSTVRESEIGQGGQAGFSSSLGKLFQAIEEKRAKDSASDLETDAERETGEEPYAGMDYRDPLMSEDQEEESIESPDAGLAQFDPRSILQDTMGGGMQGKRSARARAVFGGPRSESYFK